MRVSPGGVALLKIQLPPSGSRAGAQTDRRPGDLENDPAHDRRQKENWASRPSGGPMSDIGPGPPKSAAARNERVC